MDRSHAGSKPLFFIHNQKGKPMYKKPFLDQSKLAIEKQLSTAKSQLDAIAEQEKRKAELTEVVATLEASLAPIQKELDEIQAEADLKAEEEAAAKEVLSAATTGLQD